MTARKAFGFVALWALLTAYLFVFEREAPVEEEKPSERAALADMDAAAVTAVELRAGDRMLRCERREGRWAVVAPAGTEAPADLITTIVSALTEGNVVEVVSRDASQAGEFGLNPARATVALVAVDGVRVTISLGGRNPAQTAIYARREGSPEILLIGLNVEYYVDLALAQTAEVQKPGGGGNS